MMQTIDLSYLITPFLAWLLAGCCKFAVNCLRERRLALDLIGYGGMPSNHSAIVSSMVVLIALKEGLDSPALGVATTLAFIVMLDATSLRRHVGRHAQAINLLAAGKQVRLRERMGHSPLEVAAGVLTGGLTAWLVSL
ncbi:divergent PAP2 family protein [Ectopseudomonas khazarica]|uniref:divergent PAP2 family protein n=1 Tax=Ectopseudomonas khazarica TaxID=2502979 RepID=UPI000A6A4D56|nr:divergent PAP2 family protein [Pseudomonas khazarica]